jgi:23S rRNA pseudouridine2605 synthase
MRLNKYIAQSTGLSRRAADDAIYRNRVRVNGSMPSAGQQVGDGDTVTLDDSVITPVVNTTTIMLNKPVGYVCSREGQGSRTIYDLLPAELHILKPVGRLDKDSSGLILLTNDGALAQGLTHPRYQKNKTYNVELDKPLQPLHRQMIADHGITLDDGVSKLQLERLIDGDDRKWQVTMHEGRNRQIRRTFDVLGYDVRRLHRTVFGNYTIGQLGSGQFQTL